MVIWWLTSTKNLTKWISYPWAVSSLVFRCFWAAVGKIHRRCCPHLGIVESPSSQLRFSVAHFSILWRQLADSRIVWTHKPASAEGRPCATNSFSRKAAWNLECFWALTVRLFCWPRNSIKENDQLQLFRSKSDKRA